MVLSSSPQARRNDEKWVSSCRGEKLRWGEKKFKSLESFSPFVTQIDKYLPSFFAITKTVTKISKKWDC